MHLLTTQPKLPLLSPKATLRANGPHLEESWSKPFEVYAKERWARGSAVSDSARFL